MNYSLGRSIIVAHALFFFPLNLNGRYPEKKEVLHETRLHKGLSAIGGVGQDAILLNVNLFTVSSAKIIASFMPFYLSARMIDEDVQQNFYDRVCHSNINQLPESCHQIAQKGVGAPMVALSTLALWAPDFRLRETARMFAIGLPFVHWGKNVIKKMDHSICLRPWHQNFSKEKRSTGGFPSGHMANVTYMTTLFGIRHGWKWAVPLSLFSAFVFADFLNCNRHYLSQLIAGVGFGLLYAFAAEKVLNRAAFSRWAFSIQARNSGGAQLSCAYQF